MWGCLCIYKHTCIVTGSCVTNIKQTDNEDDDVECDLTTTAASQCVGLEAIACTCRKGFERQDSKEQCFPPLPDLPLPDSPLPDLGE